ncbi:MAG: HDOD domain-containing protein [Dissulfurispiraceae bacterium]
MNDSLRILTQKIPKLPTIPPVADKIIQLVSNEASVVGSIVDTIEKDPAISAKVISFANAAFYSMGQPVTTIRDAVMKIGFDNVKSIALGISLLTLFKGKKNGDDGEYLNTIKHSMVTGVVSKEIVDFLEYRHYEDIFTSGLLHDLGLMVMNVYFPEIYAQIIDKFKKGKSFPDAEREVCGFTHGEIGGWLADKWNLPENMCEVILSHHNPTSASSTAVAIVHLADIIAIRRGFSPVSVDGFEGSVVGAAMQMVGMNEEGLAKLAVRIEEIVAMVRNMWL